MNSWSPFCFATRDAGLPPRGHQDVVEELSAYFFFNSVNEDFSELAPVES